ncbi:MAG: hypothetical protein ACM3US_14765, partial [Sphingomonadaceae bacterium]
GGAGGTPPGRWASPLVPAVRVGPPLWGAGHPAARHARAQFFLLEHAAVHPGQESLRIRDLLAERWPHLLEPWQRLYGEMPHPPKAYVDRVAADARRIGMELSLPLGMPRSWSPGGLLHYAFAGLTGINPSPRAQNARADHRYEDPDRLHQ